LYGRESLIHNLWFLLSFFLNDRVVSLYSNGESYLDQYDRCIKLI